MYKQPRNRTALSKSMALSPKNSIRRRTKQVEITGAATLRLPDTPDENFRGVRMPSRQEYDMAYLNVPIDRIQPTVMLLSEDNNCNSHLNLQE